MADKNPYPSEQQERFIVRLPDGMRERIRRSAERNGRSMNAEIVRALEQIFPPEPTIEEVLERVHRAIEQANNAHNIPYRAVLIEALDQLSEQISSGIEMEQYRPTLPPRTADSVTSGVDRITRWRRAQKYGVEQADLERELERGLLKHFDERMVKHALQSFKSGNPQRALMALRLGDVKFADPEAAYRAIEQWLRNFYRENWGEPDQPWSYE